MEKNNYFKIEINTNLPQELIEYIFDCWVTFVVGDLGLLPNQLPISYID
jgi:hypothetical protein